MSDETPDRRLLDEAARLLAAGEPAGAESLLREALGQAPQSAAGWNDLGRALNNQRRLPEAAEALQRATELDPACAGAWNNLGHVLRALGHAGSAHDAFRRAVELAPDDPWALRNLAGSLLARGDTRAATEALEAALAASPGDHRAAVQLAHLRAEDGRRDEAAALFRRCLEEPVVRAEAAAGLGALSQREARYDEAAGWYERALADDPAHPAAALGLAAMREIQGRFEEGYALVEPVLTGGPPPAGVAVTGSRLLRRIGRLADARHLLGQVDRGRLEGRDRGLLEFELGDLAAAEGEHARAFDHYAAGNVAAGETFDADDFVRTVDRLTDYFSRGRLDALDGAGRPDPRPVLIVGMPRSGTSLVEQILAAHPRVAAMGERRDLFEAVRQLSGGEPGARWPGCLTETPPGALADLADSYLAAMPGDADRVTDKMPANFLNLGLVQCLLPAARVVYCRRDPMDTGLSCFAQNFRSGGMAFARRLEHIGLYQQGCWRLMAHWKAVLDLPMHALDYETLVREPEASVRDLLTFLGLEWHDACLRPHETARPVETASYHQVRQPIYRASVGRWRHYEARLRPLAEALVRPWPG